MRERQPRRIGNGLAQWRTAPDANRAARQPKFRENYRGCVRSVHNAIRGEDGSSVETPKEHLSTPLLKARAPAGTVGAWESLSCRITLDRPGLWIESGYPIIGTHPK